MSEQNPNDFVEEFPERFHRDRRQHGGEIDRLNEDQLERLTEEERTAAGVDSYDPDEVPPATDAPPVENIRSSEIYQEERAELARQEEAGEVRPLDAEHPFPPTRYDD